MIGDEPLAQNGLAELLLHCHPEPFRIWAIVQSSRTEGQTATIELRPFALSGAERSSWERLTQDQMQPKA
jgi:hypothetical protein